LAICTYECRAISDQQNAREHETRRLRDEIGAEALAEAQ